jgi:hypothetical protein
MTALGQIYFNYEPDFKSGSFFIDDIFGKI